MQDMAEIEKGTSKTNQHQSSNLDLPRVLIVDDDIDIVEEVSEHLESDGYDCISALDAQTAIKLVADNIDIGIVVTDIRMPGMDGMEMARKMKSDAGDDRDLIVIVITGHAGKEEAIEALKLGAHDFLSKPIDTQDLSKTISKAAVELKKLRNRREFMERLEDSFNEVAVALYTTSRELTSANKIKDSFLSMMGHELRTPINSIIGFSELLKIKSDALDYDRIDEYLDYIIMSASRLESTVDNILMLSADRTDQLKPMASSTIVSDLLAYIKDYSLASEDGPKINIVIKSPVGDDIAKLDRAMVIKALSCIIDDALKFSPANSEIVIGSECNGDELILFIKSSGISKSNNGLGIALATKIAEAHGGRLDLTSTDEMGTKASMFIPQK